MEEFKKLFFVRVLLTPFSWLWESVYFIRRAFYDYGIYKQSSFEVPVISIGNVSFGGTGKTPFTLWLSNYLHTKNNKVMILMRGYKGNLENSYGLLESGKKVNPNPEDFGDEAIMLGRRLENASIVVGKKRSANLNYYFNKVSPDVVLLDDGHQHIELKRKLNIVLFDAMMPLRNYKVAPLGYLREGLTSLKDADLVVIGRVDQVEENKVIELKNLIRPYLPLDISYAEVCYRPHAFYNSAYDKVMEVEEIRGKKVILMAGIANPKSFFKSIENLGAEVLVTESFPDHHYFKREEVDALISYAKNEDAFIVTTEKDIVRLKNIVEDEVIIFLQVELEFKTGEEEAKQIINSCLKV